MSSQCTCCASPLGEVIRCKHTERVVCLRCFGFLAAWLLELEQPPRVAPGVPVCKKCGAPATYVGEAGPYCRVHGAYYGAFGGEKV
jgi:hypothetical protein